MNTVFIRISLLIREKHGSIKILRRNILLKTSESSNPTPLSRAYVLDTTLFNQKDSASEESCA